jgi:hypothetical protein
VAQNQNNPNVKPKAPGKPIYGQPHIAVPLWLWGSGKLTTAAKNLLALLEFHRNRETGRCNPRIRTMAAELGVSPATVKRGLRELRWVKLITITWEQRSSNYTVAPVTEWLKILKHQNDPSRTRLKDQNDPSGNSEGSKLSFSLDQNDPSDHPHLLLNRNTSEQAGQQQAGRLAELAAVITETWPKLPGRPGAKLLGRIEVTLREIPLNEFRALLQSKARKVVSFGLAECLANELRTRWEADAVAQQQHIADKVAAEIQRVESILRDPRLSAEERAQYQSYLGGLRCPPKTETTTYARKGLG